MKSDKTYAAILNEVAQSHPVRIPLYEDLQKKLGGRAVIAFYTSFRYPVTIGDDDASMLQEVLQHSDFAGGLTLLINSLGGSGLTAERIIKICRTYSKGNFEVIVPHQAKSAATMICMGSKKILMSPTSELGPVDPQTIIQAEGQQQVISIAWIIKTYDELFQQAVECKGHIEPYIQQLAKYDARQIEVFRQSLKLSEDIAIASLKTGMMEQQSKQRIANRIRPFLDPLKLRTHARPIFHEQARECGLNIEPIDIQSSIWMSIWELHLRLQYITNHQFVKIIESKEESYQVSNPFIKNGGES